MKLRRLAWIALACGGCSADPGVPDPVAPAPPPPAAGIAAAPVPTPPPAASESPLLLYDASSQDAFMQALTAGELRLEHGCVYLAYGDGQRSLLILPSPHTRWDLARGTIRFGDRELRFGAEAAFGGGEVGIGDGPVAAEARRKGCDITRVWWASPERVEPRARPQAMPPPKE